MVVGPLSFASSSRGSSCRVDITASAKVKMAAPRGKFVAAHRRRLHRPCGGGAEIEIGGGGHAHPNLRPTGTSPAKAQMQERTAVQRTTMFTSRPGTTITLTMI